MKKTLRFIFGVLAASISAIVFASCIPGTDQSMPRASITTAELAQQRSWASPRANAARFLLYVSDDDRSNVEVYDYLTGTEVGEWSAPTYAELYGMCSDKGGDVYVVDTTSASYNIHEFHYGGTTPFRKLYDPGYPVGCSIDPTTGNLAVTNDQATEHTGGPDVLIYPNASGSPITYYLVGEAAIYGAAGYDPNGNLFVSAADCSQPPSQSCLQELPAGTSSFEVLNFNQRIYAPAAVQWDGKYLAIGDEDVDAKGRFGIYQVEVSGGTVAVVRTVLPKNSCQKFPEFINWAQFSKHPNDIPAEESTEILGNPEDCPGLMVWAYPRGGKAKGEFKGPGGPGGAVIVRKPS
jgi:hypothetical protein